MRFKLLQVDTLFPVPLCSFALPDAAAINGALEAEIAIRRANEPSLTVSNRGGWHSARDLFVRTEPAQRALCEALRGAIDEATRQLVPDAALASIEPQLDGWINASRAGDYHSPHDHPGAFWSGVYYVRTVTSGGEIEFQSGRAGNPHAELLPAPMSWDWTRIVPRPGVVLLFPGHLRHSVLPFDGDGERISISFNVGYRARAAQGSGQE